MKNNDPIKYALPNCGDILKLNPLLAEKPDTFCNQLLLTLEICRYQWDSENQNFYNLEIMKVISVSRLHELDPQKVRQGTQSVSQYLRDHSIRLRLGEIFKFISFIFGKLALYSTIILLIFGLFFIPFKTVALIIAVLLCCKIVFSVLSYILNSEFEKLRHSF